MKYVNKSRLAEKSVYSVKNSVLGFVLKDTETNKYLVEDVDNPSTAMSYTSDAWWSDNVDDAYVFIDSDEAFITLDDVATDFAGEQEMPKSDIIDRFEINPIYPNDIFVKNSPINRDSLKESFGDPTYNDPNKPEKHTFHVEDIVWEGRKKHPTELDVTLDMTHLYYTGDVYDTIKDKLCTGFNHGIEDFSISEEDFEFLGSLGWKVLGFF